MSKNLKNKKTFFGITQSFKYWLILIVIALVALRLYFIFLFGADSVVPEQLVLFSSLFIISFIWYLERRDRLNLLQLNTQLVITKESLLEANLNTVRTLVSTIEVKDPYTKGHCERVTEYTIKIAYKLKLPNEKKEVLKTAASIHDIGKLQVKDKILNKSTSLDDEEWKSVKEHPENAVELLTFLDFLGEEKNIILHHHERFDGEGYPEGLKGEEIPLGARIISVADSFDAMNSARAYREALPRNKIITELKEGKGSQFDPEIVNAFLEIIEDGKIEFEREK